MLDGGEEDVQLLGLRRDGAGAEVRVPGYRPEQGGGGLKPQGKSNTDIFFFKIVYNVSVRYRHR